MNGLYSGFGGVEDSPRESDVGGLSSAPGYCDTSAGGLRKLADLLYNRESAEAIGEGGNSAG